MAALTVLQRRATLARPTCFFFFLAERKKKRSPLLFLRLVCLFSPQRIVQKGGAATFACIFSLPLHQNMSLTNTKTGFSVKDILDLPDTNDEEGSITGAEEDTEGSDTTSTTKTTGVLVQSPLENVQNLPLKNPFYDSSDNPYTRWLATTDSIQYSCK